MGPGMMLGHLVLGPLELLFEVIFALSNRVLSVGMSIVALSLTVNILVLPLYRRADEMQRAEQEMEARLAPGIKHIKTVFHGDEQIMILQTFYRQHRYSPLHAMKGALPLLLQVPFFIAAYQFLSHLGCLQGSILGPIKDLGQPDQLLHIGGLTLNFLPILMTAVNLLSGLLYTKGAPIKLKAQLLGMALIFLVLLYDSPSGLTFYWTLNNLFSLGKNIIEKLMPECTQREKRVSKVLSGKPDPGLFFLCALMLTILTGLLIPSVVMANSPEEFVEAIRDPHPIWYAVNAFLLAMGTFVIWTGVYYMLGSTWVKKSIEIGTWVLFGIFLVNYLFFRNNLGTISSTLQYEKPPEFSGIQKLINLSAVILTAGIFLIQIIQKESWTRGIAWTIILAMLGMSGRNLWIIVEGTAIPFQVLERNYQGAEEIPLSRTGKNVVVLMLDRAISSYLPCILYERPELAEVYSGFVYYPNTLSFGLHTNLGAPALFGGYEYTPRAMNQRDNELLKDKHNEALLLMPTLFSQKGYRVTVFDVPYPGNYSESGDYTLFDELPNTNARIIHGYPTENGAWERPEDIRLRNFFPYSLTMCVPIILYGPLYNMGEYNRAGQTPSLFAIKEIPPTYQDLEATPSFLAQYDVLKRLNSLTSFEEKGDTLLVMVNGTTHQPTLLQEPTYEPAATIDNATYDAEHQERFLAGPFALTVKNDYQMAHYQVNMAALTLVGDWLEKMKAEGAYDNTRIIIVADHGFWLRQIQEGQMESGEDIMGYNPLLMVKNFNASGPIQTDMTFMTNADVPTLAMTDVVENPVNPFTGKLVNSDEKQNTQYVSISRAYEVGKEKGNTYDPGRWYKVTPGGETLFDQSRWILESEIQ